MNFKIRVWLEWISFLTPLWTLLYWMKETAPFSLLVTIVAFSFVLFLYFVVPWGYPEWTIDKSDPDVKQFRQFKSFLCIFRMSSIAILLLLALALMAAHYAARHYLIDAVDATVLDSTRDSQGVIALSREAIVEASKNAPEVIDKHTSFVASRRSDKLFIAPASALYEHIVNSDLKELNNVAQAFAALGLMFFILLKLGDVFMPIFHRRTSQKT